jgi:4-hydroxy-tetrahydrodipicolinate synthase
MKLTPNTRGTFAIAPTPFHDDGRIDVNSIDRMTDFYLEAGCTGITVLGIMGEAPKLEPQEALDIACRMIKRAAAPLSLSASRRPALPLCARLPAASWRRAPPA